MDKKEAKETTGPIRAMEKTVQAGVGLSKRVVTSTRNVVVDTLSPSSSKEHKVTSSESSEVEKKEGLLKEVKKALERPEGHKYVKIQEEPTHLEEFEEMLSRPKHRYAKVDQPPGRSHGRMEHRRSNSAPELRGLAKRFQEMHVEVEIAKEVRAEHRPGFFQRFWTVNTGKEVPYAEGDQDTTRSITFDKHESNTEQDSTMNDQEPETVNLQQSKGWLTFASQRSFAEIDLEKTTEFLLNPIIFVICALLLAIVPVALYRTVYSEKNGIAAPIVVAWILAALIVGEAFGDWKRSKWDESMTEQDEGPKESLPVLAAVTKRLSMQAGEIPAQKEEPEKPHNWTHRVLHSVNPARFRRKQQWREHMVPADSSPLVQWLNEDSTLRQRPSMMVSTEGDADSERPHLTDTASPSMGAIDIAQCPAESLEDSGVQPVLELLGMDVFMTGQDGPEDNMAEHPYLIKHGLREHKIAMVNIMLPWANMLVYFKLPDWVDDFDDIEVKADDEDEVKILKSFLKGDDAFRNERLRLLPALVDGPRMIKLLAPNKAEMAIPTGIVPITWNKISGKKLPNGKVFCPLVEVEFDCMSNKALRAMANVFKRHFNKLTLDLAVIIRCPEHKQEESCCVGMWRFNKIDLSECPALPERKMPDQEVLRRASTMVALSTEQLSAIKQVA